MKQIKNFSSLTAHLKKLEARKRVVAVWPSDKNTEEAISRVLHEGWADFILVGPSNILDTFQSLKQYGTRVSVVGVSDCDEAAREAVRIVRDGGGDVVMKGLINTDNLLRAVLNKETGLLPRGKVLTHLTAMQGGRYGKFLFSLMRLSYRRLHWSSGSLWSVMRSIFAGHSESSVRGSLLFITVRKSTPNSRLRPSMPKSSGWLPQANLAMLLSTARWMSRPLAMPSRPKSRELPLRLMVRPTRLFSRILKPPMSFTRQ